MLIHSGLGRMVVDQGWRVGRCVKWGRGRSSVGKKFGLAGPICLSNSQGHIKAVILVMMKCQFSVVEETRVPGGNHRSTASN